MNGNGSKIEIFKPFGEAFELMKKILFQPFDLKKWLVIGFAAWLANLGGGGGGAGNFNYPDNRREDAQKLNETIGQIPQPVLITGICVLICVVLLLVVLLAWLRARAIHFCGLRRSESRYDCRTVEGIPGRGKQLFPVLTARRVRAPRGDRDCRSSTHCAVYPLG